MVSPQHCWVQLLLMRSGKSELLIPWTWGQIPMLTSWSLRIPSSRSERRCWELVLRPLFGQWVSCRTCNVLFPWCVRAGTWAFAGQVPLVVPRIFPVHLSHSCCLVVRLVIHWSLPRALLYAPCSPVATGCSTSVDVVFVPGAGGALQLSMPAAFNSSVA